MSKPKKRAVETAVLFRKDVELRKAVLAAFAVSPEAVLQSALVWADWLVEQGAQERGGWLHRLASAKRYTYGYPREGESTIGRHDLPEITLGADGGGHPYLELQGHILDSTMRELLGDKESRNTRTFRVFRVSARTGSRGYELVRGRFMLREQKRRFVTEEATEPCET